MKNTSINEKSAIFTTCHKLTRALVDNAENPAISYRATFTACIRLYYTDIRAFITACHSMTVNTNDIALVKNDDFDVFGAFSRGDNVKALSLINFAFYYARKRLDAKRTISEIAEDIESDNVYPRIVDSLNSNDTEDVKNDIVAYLYARVNDSDFMQLPNMFKLIRAGECAISLYERSAIRHTVHNAFSIDSFTDEDSATDKSAILADKREMFADMDKCDIIEFIIDNLPKARRATPEKRDIVRKFLHQYYSNHGKSGYRIADIAERLNTSARNLGAILSEVRAIGYDTIAYRDK